MTAIASVVATACSTAADETTTSADDMIAVARLMVTFDRVISEEDTEGLLALIADDAVRMSPDQAAVVGKRASGAHYRELFDRYDIEVVHEPLEIDAAGDLIIHRGNVTGTMTPRAGGEPIQLNDKYLYVIKRQADGSLLVWREMFNRSAPPG
jgi:ketosteroid isomerase-like protein